MKKNHFLPLITAGVITASIVSPGIAGAETTPSNENLVKMDTIKNMVSNFTYGEEIIPDVNKNDLNNFQNVLDFEGNLIGYAFEITQDNKDFFVLASNNYELDPIVSFGEGRFSDEQTDDVSKENIYYDGAFKVASEDEYEEQILTESQDQTAAQGLSSKGKGTKKGAKKTIKKSNIKKDHNFLQYDTSNKKKWNQLKQKRKKTNSFSGQSVLPERYSLSATRYYQRTSGVRLPKSACGPTTGAMFAQYLKAQMGYNVKGRSSYSSEASFINHMTDEMSTTILGTLPGFFASGLNRHLEHNYPLTHNAWSITQTPAYGNFDEYKKEIAHYKFPVALYARKNFDDNADFDYHYVLGVGYKYSSGSAYLAIKDPDGSDSGTRWHAKWNDNNDYMTMIRANYNKP